MTLALGAEARLHLPPSGRRYRADSEVQSPVCVAFH